MRYLGMKSKHAPEKTISVIVKKSKWVRAPHSGMFQMRIQNGAWVKKRSLLGIVTDPFGEFENRVYAPNDGFIFGVNSAPIVNRGDALFHLSTAVKEESVEL
jgi:predicted deacylase